MALLFIILRSSFSFSIIYNGNIDIPIFLKKKILILKRAVINIKIIV